jgi:hypothetical protein
MLKKRVSDGRFLCPVSKNARFTRDVNFSFMKLVQFDKEKWWRFIDLKSLAWSMAAVEVLLSMLRWNSVSQARI